MQGGKGGRQRPEGGRGRPPKGPVRGPAKGAAKASASGPVRRGAAPRGAAGPERSGGRPERNRSWGRPGDNRGESREDHRGHSDRTGQWRDAEAELTDISAPWAAGASPDPEPHTPAARPEERSERRTRQGEGRAEPGAPVRRDRPRPPGSRTVPRDPGRATHSEAQTGPHLDAGSRDRLPSAAPPRSRPKLTPAEPAAVSATGMVQHQDVTADEDGMRLDRWLKAHYPDMAFSQVQRVIRTGELRVDGRRADANTRLAAGQSIRVPPLRLEVQTKARMDAAEGEAQAFLKEHTLWEDADVLVLNKPMGLAVQGGSGMVRHVDGILATLTTDNGQRPRLVHRLDKDTSGCLLIAKTRFAATALTRSFRSREARKIYWALVAGVPKLRQGRISGFLAKDEVAEAEGEAKMRTAEHGEDGAVHAVTYYSVVEKAGKIASWVSLKPVTGRTHQLRAHMAEIGNPIIGDAKYFERDKFELPEGMQNRLHLLARRISIPHPRTGKPIDVTAPLPAHMRQSWSLLGFDADRYDPIDDAPEE